MKIGLMGFEFASSNKGCEALSDALMPVLLECLGKQPVEILQFWKRDDLGSLPQMYPHVTFRGVDVKLKKIHTWPRILRAIRECDVVLDITHGDSFSDLYGKRWFCHTTLLKQAVLWCRVPLILMPQTYGPFRDPLLRRWAMHVIASSRRVYCRDALSSRYLYQQLPASCHDKIAVYADLAFALPWEKPPAGSGGLRVGMNVSGLLWHDGGKSMGLACDYRAFCRMLLEHLLARGDCHVTLIPHVICDEREGPDYYENDCQAIRALLEEFPQCAFAARIQTAREAKTVTGAQDVFIGARMHAAIGAYSAGTACIPFAYSRKFAGVFLDLGYPWMVDGQTLTAEEAAEAVLALVDRRQELQAQARTGMELVRQKLAAFSEDLAQHLGK